MLGRLQRGVRRGLHRLGLDVVRTRPAVGDLPPDFDDDLRALCAQVRPHTLSSPERVAALRDAVRHVVARGIPGAFVECGVWRGGSMLAVASTLVSLGVTDRELVLFDTFDEHPPPTDVDVDLRGVPARDHMAEVERTGGYGYLPPDQVRAVVAGSGYPLDRITAVAGMVEDTIPADAPDLIALCRLDTDWYASTAHEMRHLYPRLSPGGILLVDDYGHFAGARRAVDEYFDDAGLTPLLHRIDYTGRMVVKDPA